MSGLTVRQPAWRRLLLALLATPAVSVLVALALVWGQEHVPLALPMPLGMHTLVPLVVLVPLPVVAAGALATLLLAAALYATGFARVGRRPSAARSVALLVSAQALLFGAQLLVVHQVHGVPDAALVVLAAGVVQAVMLGFTGTGAVALGFEFVAPPAVSRRIRLLDPALPRPILVPVFAAADPYRYGSRRGPPSLLLSD